MSYKIFLQDLNFKLKQTVDLSTLNGLKVGINKGSVQVEIFENWCRENNIDCEIILYKSSKDRYKDMNSGMLDATISTNVSGKEIVKYNWKSILKIGSSPYYFAINKQRPDILKELNETNAKILQSDWYYKEKVYLKYYGQTSAASTGLSSEDLEFLKQKQQIKVGYVKKCLPYADTDATSGKMIGLLTTFTDHMRERYNVKLQAIEFDTYEQMHDALFDDRIDIMFPVYGSYWIAEENSRANRQFAEQIYQPPIFGG